ncbi:MAG: hypothetical protein SH821_16740 [Phototrophicales bacterium]|nr:hypothetical protein [Phototrophicales bacterium]
MASPYAIPIFYDENWQNNPIHGVSEGQAGGIGDALPYTPIKNGDIRKKCRHRRCCLYPYKTENPHWG